MALLVNPIKTPIFSRGENLLDFLIKNISPDPGEDSLIAISSKIVSLSENRLVPRNTKSKVSIMQDEADYFLGKIGHNIHLAIKQGLFFPAAGIDESNSESDDYILHPSSPFESAKKIREALTQAWKLKNLGVILTDSHSGPLRLGVTGVALAFAGFHPIKDQVGKKDLFGRRLKMTKANLADSLAAAAVLMMGEADERTPIAILKGAPVEFNEEVHPNELIVDIDDDIYRPLYEALLPAKLRRKN